MSFIFEKLEIEGLVLITPKVYPDERGWFSETYKLEEFFKNNITSMFDQDNHSYSVKNVLRGLHFQKEPMPQGKLVRCVRGRILDVAVDIRPNSSTFKQWVGVSLDDISKEMLYIPEGMAHGFLTLSDEAEICYKCTRSYRPQLDAGIRWDDPDLNISWGISNPIVSEKDQKLPLLKEIF